MFIFSLYSMDIIMLMLQPEFDAQFARHEHAHLSFLRKLGECLKKQFMCRRDRMLEFLLGFFPFVNLLRTYKPQEYMMGDIISGLVVGVMNIPQVSNRICMLSSFHRVNIRVSI